MNDSLARIYLAFTSTLTYTLALSYVTCTLFKVKVFNKIRILLQRALKYALPLTSSYLIPYIFLQNRISALLVHVTLISLPTILSKITLGNHKITLSKNSFCDGFIVKGYIVKRIILLLQVYPLTSLDDTVNKLIKYGEIFLLKNPFGYIILFKRTTLCFSYRLWKRLFLKHFLSFSQDVVQTFCHLRVLSYKEVCEIINRLYAPVEPMSSKNMPPFDLIYFPKNGGIQSYSIFKCDSSGLNILSIKKRFFTNGIRFDGQANFRIIYDDKYILLKSLHVFKRLVEEHGKDCHIKASLVEDDSGYRVKLLSSPQIFFEKDQLNLQLTLYSINFNLPQKG